MQVIIGIGFDGTGDPTGFSNSVLDSIRAHGTLLASITGESYSDQFGAEEGEWFAAEFDGFEQYNAARDRILLVAATHNQDAVAFTVGNTDVASTPNLTPASRGYYRDFL